MFSIVIALLGVYLSGGAYIAFCSRDQLEEKGEFDLCSRWLRIASLATRCMAYIIFYPAIFATTSGLDAIELGLRLRAPAGRRRQHFIDAQLPFIIALREKMRESRVTWAEIADSIKSGRSNFYGTIIEGLLKTRQARQR